MKDLSDLICYIENNISACNLALFDLYSIPNAELDIIKTEEQLYAFQKILDYIKGR